MIPLHVLKKIRVLITHANCADGIASALIVKQVLPHVEVQFLQYNTKAWKELKPESGMLFCDFSPCPERADEFIEAGAIVLDHHEGVRDLVAKFGDLGIYADAKEYPGIGGASLAFTMVYTPIAREVPHKELDEWKDVRQFAKLVGIQDTWQTSSPLWENACALSGALKFWPLEELLKMAPAQWMTLLSVGKALQIRNRQKDEQTFAGARFFDTSFGRLCVFQGESRDASDIAERYKEHAEVFAAFSCFVDDGEQVMGVSMRSGGSGVSVLPLAQLLGGGGHEKAAGFRCSLQAQDPWTLVATALMDIHQRRQPGRQPGRILKILMPPITLTVEK